MKVGAAVRAVSHRRISVRNELVLVGAESLPGFLGGLFENDNHEGTHEEGRVALLGVVERRVVVDFVVLILGIIHEFLELLAEEVDFTQVERAEVSEEWLIHEVVIDAEVESVLARLRRVLVADPVKAPRDDLDGLVRVCVTLTRSSFSLGLHHFFHLVFADASI